MPSPPVSMSIAKTTFEVATLTIRRSASLATGELASLLDTAECCITTSCISDILWDSSGCGQRCFEAAAVVVGGGRRCRAKPTMGRCRAWHLLRTSRCEGAMQERSNSCNSAADTRCGALEREEAAVGDIARGRHTAATCQSCGGAGSVTSPALRGQGEKNQKTTPPRRLFAQRSGSKQKQQAASSKQQQTNRQGSKAPQQGPSELFFSTI